MKKTKEKTPGKHIIAKVPEELHKKLKIMAVEKGVSMAELTKDIITRYLYGLDTKLN